MGRIRKKYSKIFKDKSLEFFMEEETWIVGQGGGPTPVLNCELAGFLKEAKKSGKVKRVLGMRNGIEGLLHADEGKVIDISDWEPDVVGRIRTGAVLGITRNKYDARENDREIKMLSRNLDRLGAKGMVYFGGNDSADVLNNMKCGARRVHGVKTIDNDLVECFVTPGFLSAARFNAEAVKKLDRDVGSYVSSFSGVEGAGWRVATLTIFQTMGRDTGWLALATAFAKINGVRNYIHEAAPHIILIPEMKFERDKYLSALDNLLVSKGNAFVSVSEGVYEMVSGKKVLLAEFNGALGRDPHGHKEFGRYNSGSAAQFLTELAMKELKVSNVRGIKPTISVPQHLQRCYADVAVDVSLGYRVGRECAQALLDGDDGVSVVLQRRGRIVPKRVPLEKVAGKVRKVGEEYHGNSIFGPTQKFFDDYVFLIGVHDFPRYGDLDFSKVVGLE